MNQKEEEKLVMAMFRKHYPEFPKGKLLVSESPDFILRQSRKKNIGIELTRLDGFSDNLFDRLKTSIDRKETKLKNYRRAKFSALWLIIYTDDISGRKSVNLQNAMDTWMFPSSFDEVFLYDLFDNKVFRSNLN